jgi:hypothetical protein
MKITTRDDTIAFRLARVTLPIERPASVGYRTVEFECNFEARGGGGGKLENSIDRPAIASGISEELRPVFFLVGRTRRPWMLKKS